MTSDEAILLATVSANLNSELRSAYLPLRLSSSGPGFFSGTGTDQSRGKELGHQGLVLIICLRYEGFWFPYFTLPLFRLKVKIANVVSDRLPYVHNKICWNASTRRNNSQKPSCIPGQAYSTSSQGFARHLPHIKWVSPTYGAMHLLSTKPFALLLLLFPFPIQPQPRPDARHDSCSPPPNPQQQQ